MKFITFLMVALICIALVNADDGFDLWALKHGKVYASKEERAHRRQVYNENLKTIHQKDSIATAYFTPNKFSDMTKEEFQRFYLRPITETKRQEIIKSVGVIQPKLTGIQLPTSFNWVEKGAVTGVKDQAQCGSCWAFGSIGNAEGQHWKSTGKLVSLSEQNLVDCDHECQVFPNETSPECDEGCNGGMEPNAFNYMLKSGGIMSETAYPYKGSAGTCKFDKTKIVATFKDWSFVNCDEKTLMEFLYTNGPVSIGVHADEWQFYSGGVFNSKCKTENDHAVLLTGWDQSDQNVPYWIIKNSWGLDWGIDGYMHMIRGSNKCGMLNMMSTIHA